MIAVLSGCIKISDNDIEPKKGALQTQPVYVWGVQKMAVDPMQKGAGVYNDLLYKTSYDSKGYLVEFYDFSGTKSYTVPIGKGKGPGEVMYLTAVRVSEDVIHIYDYALKKIVRYSVKGDHIDDIMIDTQLPLTDFQVVRNEYFFAGALDQLICKVNSEGEVSQKIEYDEGLLKHGDRYPGGIVAADDLSHSLYIGYSNLPYRIEEYSKDLKKTMTISKKVREKSDPVRIYSPKEWRGMYFPQGKFAIHSMAFDEKYIYVSYGAGFHYTSQGIELLPVKNALNVFDKNNGEYIYDISCEQLKNSSFGYALLGVTDKYIVLGAMTILEKDLMDNMQIKTKDNLFWFIILKKPI